VQCSMKACRYPHGVGVGVYSDPNCAKHRPCRRGLRCSLCDYVVKLLRVGIIVPSAARSRISDAFGKHNRDRSARRGDACLDTRVVGYRVSALTGAGAA
jgi:hypothetical protein